MENAAGFCLDFGATAGNGGGPIGQYILLWECGLDPRQRSGLRVQCRSGLVDVVWKWKLDERDRLKFTKNNGEPDEVEKRMSSVLDRTVSIRQLF